MPPVVLGAPGRDEKGEGSLGLISGMGAAWRMGGEVVVLRDGGASGMPVTTTGEDTPLSLSLSVLREKSGETPPYAPPAIKSVTAGADTVLSATGTSVACCWGAGGAGCAVVYVVV